VLQVPQIMIRRSRRNEQVSWKGRKKASQDHNEMRGRHEGTYPVPGSGRSIPMWRVTEIEMADKVD